MGPFRTLYLDMNSFFASVEQQMNPAIRGVPLAITAMENDKGCCVAASYEAKAFGVRTGSSVADARRLCPGIVFLPSRHRLYVRFNLRVAAVIDRLAELERIRSVDEFQVRLSGDATTLDGARELVATMKRAVANEVGEYLRFSAGIGVNHLTAKIAGKLEKPDGCQHLGPDNMPGRIAHLQLDDLPGISAAMRARLERAGVKTVPDLCALDPRHARAIWNSVEGERFVRSLQGWPIPLVKTQRGGYGNSKVLAPDFRTPQAAYLVTRWLIEKSAARLRRDGRVAASFSLHLNPMGAAPLARSVRCAPTQDTLAFLSVNRTLWCAAWPALRRARLHSVGVNLGDVGLMQDRNGDLLTPIGAGERTQGERVSEAADFINQRFGAGTIRFGINQPHPGFFERGYPVTGGQISAGKGRLDFNMPAPEEDKAEIEERLNLLCSRGLVVSSEWITDEAFVGNSHLVKTQLVHPPVLEGTIRLVRVGSLSETIDLQPCGGTHVSNTSEIGHIRLGKIENKGRNNRRVTISID